MKPFLTLILLFFGLPVLVSAAQPEYLYCGFSESAAWPSQNIIIENPGPGGTQLTYHTTHGDDVFVFITTMPNIPNEKQTDMTLLIHNSQGGGFIEASARGLVESEKKWNGVATQTPMQRNDQGLYFVRVSCGI